MLQRRSLSIGYRTESTRASNSHPFQSQVIAGNKAGLYPLLKSAMLELEYITTAGETLAIGGHSSIIHDAVSLAEGKIQPSLEERISQKLSSAPSYCHRNT